MNIRILSSAWISLLAFTVFVQAATPATPGTSPAKATTRPAFTQPSARQTARLTYLKRAIVDAYENGAHRDPKWDAPAREALMAFVTRMGNDPIASGDENITIMVKSIEAFKAGCRDPLVCYVHARGTAEVNAPQQVQIDMHGQAAGRVMKTPYGPFMTATLCFMGAWFEHGGKEVMTMPGWNDDSRKFADHAMSLMPQVLADKDLPPELLLGLLATIGGVSKDMEGDRLVLIDKVMKMMETAQPKSMAQTALGATMIVYAWDARGSGYANTVSKEGWKLFGERIALGRQLLEEAFSADQNNCEAATKMLTIAKAQNFPRAEMEKWFSRAMDLDPCNFNACFAKLDYLEPKWHGSDRDMIEFGRRMARDGSWAGGIPGILTEAHWRIAERGPGAKGPMPDVSYFSRPGVWEDMQPVYEEYLKRVPESQLRRTRYMLVAAWSGHWEVAAEQLELMRGKPSPQVLPPKEMQLVVEEIRKHTKQ